jgi:hypothetical protein
VNLNIKKLWNSLKGNSKVNLQRDLDNTDLSNGSIRKKQGGLLILLLLIVTASVFGAVFLIQERQQKKQTIIDPKLKLEVAAESIDPEKMWRKHFEDTQTLSEQRFEERLKQMETSFAEREQEILKNTKQEIAKMQEQVKFVGSELSGATRALKIANERLASDEQEPINLEPVANFGKISLNDEVELDIPKSSNNYVPETSFVTGYLLGGLRVSTGLNAPNENATPVVIRLTEAGNLPKNFAINIATCRILGSSYGDLSSESAIIRAERMICTDPVNELVTTTDIAGVVHGPDGANGIKGKVIATSDKHIKNAMMGGIISGLANSAKGQDAMTLTGLGAINGKKKGFGQMAGEGLLSGTSNAAEKIAEYYLRQAEAMSPVLVIPGGVKVNVIFTKGFYLGQIGTHKRIKELRQENKQATQTKQTVQTTQKGQSEYE